MSATHFAFSFLFSYIMLIGFARYNPRHHDPESTLSYFALTTSNHSFLTLQGNHTTAEWFFLLTSTTSNWCVSTSCGTSVLPNACLQFVHVLCNGTMWLFLHYCLYLLPAIVFQHEFVYCVIFANEFMLLSTCGLPHVVETKYYSTSMFCELSSTTFWLFSFCHILHPPAIPTILTLLTYPEKMEMHSLQKSEESQCLYRDMLSTLGKASGCTTRHVATSNLLNMHASEPCIPSTCHGMTPPSKAEVPRKSHLFSTSGDPAEAEFQLCTFLDNQIYTAPRCRILKLHQIGSWCS